MCTLMFTAAPFTIARHGGKQSAHHCVTGSKDGAQMHTREHNSAKKMEYSHLQQQAWS